MNEKITELVQKIEKWAEDRNIIQGSTPWFVRISVSPCGSVFSELGMKLKTGKAE
ncbi:hypothetical protein [Pasteurella multocida]|uniref:hypothetical protein n=1 Tax=Pasteurella multocida TaxID=747 RepID=UPI003D33BF8A